MIYVDYSSIDNTALKLHLRIQFSSFCDGRFQIALYAKYHINEVINRLANYKRGDSDLKSLFKARKDKELYLIKTFLLEDIGLIQGITVRIVQKKLLRFRF